MKTTCSSKTLSFALAAALSASLSFISPVAQGAPVLPQGVHSYIVDLNSKQVTDLGSLGEGPTLAKAINDAGQVVGYFGGHAFITGPNGEGMTDLGSLAGGYTHANDINDIGQVVGYSTTAAGATHAFITGPNGVGMTDLGTLGGYKGEAYSEARSINNSGQVVEYSTTAAGAHHAFITGPNGVGMSDLGTGAWGYGSESSAEGINDAGQVVGVSNGRAFITRPNGVDMINLGKGAPQDINAAGQVVEFSNVFYNTFSYAFIAGLGVDMTNLGTLGGVYQYSSRH